MVALGVLVLLIGWATMMASMERHAALFGVRNASTRATLRIGAWLAFAAGLALFIAARGIEQGPVYWTVSLMLGAIATVLVATWAANGAERGSR
jgi:hypothetical protein